MFLTSACSSEPPPPPPTQAATVAAPLQRTVIDWDEYIGRFVADEDVQLIARVSGPVSRVAFRDGRDVRKGDLLFEIDPRPFRATLAEAEASVASARASLANAQSQASRGTELLGFDAISREEADNLAATLRSARATLAGAEARRQAAQLDLSFAQVRAPISGRVSNRLVDVGDFVTAGQTELTRIVRINPIRFSFDGAESFYLKYIRQDADGERRSSRYAANPVEIQLADEPEFRWRGKMEFINNGISPETGTIQAYAMVDNPNGFLVPGMFGRARLLGSGTYNALLVPDEAILTDQTRKLVYVLGKGNKVTPRPVSTGPMVEGLRVIRDGIAPTERIVVDGLAQLQPGMVVTPRKGTIKARAKGDAPIARPNTAPAPAQATAR
ncbi:efflux RND transporter periplasmic adaptor subunit [Blastomonas aquatica]|nr:efflux RND transporter periplasmic adaptor subunit [Blastomonas aquatica]